MKYSIVVPVYNVGNYIIKCLESIKNQTFKGDYEVIIVNDGSTDKSEEIIKKYIQKLSNFKLYNQKNEGVSSARNYGIEKARGEFLLFVDGDDYIAPNTLEVFEEYLKYNPDIIVFDYYTDNNGALKKVHSYDDTVEDKVNRYITSVPSPCNKLFSKKLFENIKFLKNVYYEDLATIPKLAKLTDNIIFIEQSLYYYVKRNNSIMNNMKYNPKMDTIFVVLEQLRDYYALERHDEIEYLHIEHLLRGASLRYIDCNCKDQLTKIINIMSSNYPKWQKNKYYKKLKLK